MKKKFSFKILIQVIFDTLIIFSSFIISFFLRGQIDLSNRDVMFSQYSKAIVWYMLIIIIVKLVMFWLFGLYRRIWKYASIKDMIAIIEAVLSSSVLMVMVFYILGYPISIFGYKIDF